MNTGTPEGLVPIVATPFNTDGSLDRSSLRRLVQFQFDAGADGVALFGMASEAFALTDEDRRVILDETRSVAAGRPITAGVSATSGAVAADQVRRLAEQEVSAVMVLPPHLVKPTGGQLKDFYAEVATAASGAGMTVMIQDAPGASSVQMPADLLVEMAKIDGVDSIKAEAPPTVVKILQLRERMPNGVKLIGGQNAQFLLDEYEAGAVGTMPACEFTDVLAEILADWGAGRTAAARSRFTSILPLVLWGLLPGYAWSVHKHVMVMRGLIDNPTVRLPACELPPAALPMLNSVVERLQAEGNLPELKL